VLPSGVIVCNYFYIIFRCKHLQQLPVWLLMLVIITNILMQNRAPQGHGACSTAHRSNRPDHWDGLMLDRSAVGQLSPLSSRTKWQRLPAGDTLHSVKYKKVKERIVLREIHLRTTGRHLSMGSHSVICHPTEVTAPPSPQPGRLVLDLSTP